MQLTEGRKYSLKRLAAGPRTGPQISIEARNEGVNLTSQGSIEWADKHLLWLRRSEFAELTGERIDNARVHRITDKGRALLADLP